MSKYRITDADLPYAAEFKTHPVGFHSPGLQRVLNVLRGGPKAGKFVLIVLEPFKKWVLGRLPSGRGEPVEILEGEEFTNLEEAEWAVFKRRWAAKTGRELDL